MKKKVITSIKFITLVIIFYALLACNVFHIGDKLVPNTKDYVGNDEIQKNQNIEDIYLDGEIIPQEQTGHFAADIQANLDKLCDDISICDKIEFQGHFSTTEKYSYTKIIGKIIEFIDENSNEDKDMKEVINIIEISKQNGDRRGYATRNTIIFNIGYVQSRKEFIDLSTHEMGHIIDLGYIQGTAIKKDKNFTEFGKVVFAINDPSLSFYKLSRDKEKIRKAEAKKKDFCSGYGMSDPFEDLAECFNLYTNHNSFFKQAAKSDTILKKKYNFIASIFDGQYISSNIQDLSLIKSNTSRRPRDTTKISN